MSVAKNPKKKFTDGDEKCIPARDDANSWGSLRRLLAGACLLLAAVGCSNGTDHNVPTFAKDIAPIVYQNCSNCHREGEAAPFELISYEDVSERAEQIAEVVQTRYMPPWLPEDGHLPLVEERRLTDIQIETIQLWVAGGKPHGDDQNLPELPKWTVGWQLGEPDLIVSMDQAYELPAEGKDIYRNFVLPIPVDRPRWVRGIELRPQNRAVVHHAFMLTNRGGESRRLAEQDPEPGYGGMEAEGADSPDGHFISWQPGKRPTFAPEGMAWQLTPGTDLVLQMHLQPSGKPESVTANVGFFFTDQPPTKFPVKIVLRSTDIDISGGDPFYIVETSFALPVDVQLLGVIPHAHYLGKTLEAIAELPGGRQQILLRIPDWDFNWQGDYRFAEPVNLPRGTRIVQRFQFDNSSRNPRNPNSPPQRVRYGLQSSDEMAELWLQVLPQSAEDRQELLRSYGRRAINDIADRSRQALAEDPNDVKALVDLGKTVLALRSAEEAEALFRRAVEADPDSTLAQYFLGHALLRQGQQAEAIEQFQTTLALDDAYLMAWHDWGMAHLNAKEPALAEERFRKSLSLDPYHRTSLNNLGLVLLQQNKLVEGIEILERAKSVSPQDPRLEQLLEQARQAVRGL